MRVRSGREAITEGREWLECHHGGSGVVGRPFVTAGSGLEVLPEG